MKKNIFVMFVLFVFLLSFSVHAAFSDVTDFIGSIQVANTGLDLYDNHKEAIDLGFLFFLFLLVFWLGLEPFFKEGTQRGTAKGLAFVLALGAAIASFKAGISIETGAPFMIYFLLFTLTVVMWILLQRVFKPQTTWGKFLNFLLAALIVFGIILVANESILDGQYDIPGKELVSKIGEGIASAYHKIVGGFSKSSEAKDGLKDTGDNTPVPPPEEVTKTEEPVDSGNVPVEKSNMWVWILGIIGLLALGGLTWFFLRRRNNGNEREESGRDSEPPSGGGRGGDSGPSSESSGESRESSRPLDRDGGIGGSPRSESSSSGGGSTSRVSRTAPEISATSITKPRPREELRTRGERVVMKSSNEGNFFTRILAPLHREKKSEPDRVSFQESREHFKNLSDPVEMNKIREFDEFDTRLRGLP